MFIHGGVFYLARGLSLVLLLRPSDPFAALSLVLSAVREDAETFIMKAYRYFIYPELMKKGVCACGALRSLAYPFVPSFKETNVTFLWG
jgi:hypothetical protein